MKYKNTKTGAIIETSKKQKANKAEGDSKDDAQEGTE